MAGARDMRLQADYEHLRRLAAGSGGMLTIESALGRPPDQYVLTYRCRGIERLVKEKPVYRDLHRVRVKLPAHYPAPSAPPVVEMLTPIFHPHVFPNLAVCMGSWQTTEYLEDFAIRLGALLQYDRRYLNIKDPANEQAMYWVSRNLALLPTDTRAFAGDASQEEVSAEDENQRLWHDYFSTAAGGGVPVSTKDENQPLWHEWLDLDSEQEPHV